MLHTLQISCALEGNVSIKVGQIEHLCQSAGEEVGLLHLNTQRLCCVYWCVRCQMSMLHVLLTHLYHLCNKQRFGTKHSVTHGTYTYYTVKDRAIKDREIRC